MYEVVILFCQCDLVSSRLMAMERVDEWVHAIGIKPSTSFVEASAKNNENIRTIFRKLYEQAVKINSSSSSATPSDPQHHNVDDDQHLHRSRESRPSSQDPFLKRHLSANAARMAGKRSTGSTLSPDSAMTNGGSNGGAGQKAEPGLSRSRSLIRRVRKPKVKDAADPNVNDCVIS